MVLTEDFNGILYILAFNFKGFNFLYILIWILEGRPGRSRVLYLSASATKRCTDCLLAVSENLLTKIT